MNQSLSRAAAESNTDSPAEDYQGKTSLMLAAKAKNRTLVKAFLKARIRFNKADSEGVFLIMHYAA